MNRILLTVAAVVVLAACGKPAPVPSEHFYHLQLGQPPPVAAGPVLNGIIQVERFSAAGVLEQRAILHGKDAAEVQAYHYHAWTEVPAVMLQMQMVRFLRAAGAATTVVTPEQRLAPDYILRGRILRLEQRTASPPMGIVELELSVQRQRDRRLVWLQTYRQRLRAHDASVAAAVAAMAQALTQIYADFLRDVAAQETQPTP